MTGDGGRADALEVPADALVILVGPSGCGKSTFARRRFADDEIVSSDACRRLVSGDAGDQSASPWAFPVFHAILRGRLAMGRRAVADATNLAPGVRARLRGMAERWNRPVVAIAFDVPLETCVARQAERARQVRREVVARHHDAFLRALADLPHEGYARLYVVRPT